MAAPPPCTCHHPFDLAVTALTPWGDQLRSQIELRRPPLLSPPRRTCVARRQIPSKAKAYWGAVSVCACARPLPSLSTNLPPPSSPSVLKQAATLPPQLFFRSAFPPLLSAARFHRHYCRHHRGDVPRRCRREQAYVPLNGASNVLPTLARIPQTSCAVLLTFCLAARIAQMWSSSVIPPRIAW